MVWHYTPTGMFTVPSAYKLGLRNLLTSAASCSNPNTDWALLWKCKLPPKISIFAWQLCNNALAIGTNLYSQKIRRTAHCPRYSDPTESDLHLFFLCPYVKAAWRSSDFNPLAYITQATSWLNLLRIIFDAHHGSYHKLSQFITCLWGLWSARNDWIFSKKYRDGGDVLRRSLDFLSITQSAMKDADIAATPALGSNVRWKAPGRSVLKLNTDTSYKPSGAGYGFVLRDHTGHPLLSGAGKLLHIISAEHGEIMAAWRSLEQISSYWNRPIILETDCLRLICQLEDNTTNLAPTGGIVTSFQKFL